MCVFIPPAGNNNKMRGEKRQSKKKFDGAEYVLSKLVMRRGKKIHDLTEMGRVSPRLGRKGNE